MFCNCCGTVQDWRNGVTYQGQSRARDRRRSLRNTSLVAPIRDSLSKPPLQYSWFETLDIFI